MMRYLTNTSAGVDPAAELEEEACKPRGHKSPGQPTLKQLEDHGDAHHIPYRTWCPECVGARATFDYLVTRHGAAMRNEADVSNNSILFEAIVAKDSMIEAVFMSWSEP